MGCDGCYRSYQPHDAPGSLHNAPTLITFRAVMTRTERAGRALAACVAATCLFLAACSPNPVKASPHPKLSPSPTLILPTAAPVPLPTPPPPPVPPGSVPPGFTPNSVTFVSL